MTDKNPVVPPTPEKRTLDSVQESAEAKLEKGVGNEAFNMKLKDVVNYIKEVKKLIKQNEERGQQLQQAQAMLQQDQKRTADAEAEIKAYQNKININAENIASASARQLVRTTTFLGLPRKPEKIIEDYKIILEELKKDLIFK